MNWKKVKQMIESASTKSDAINMLNTWRDFGSLSEDLYNRGRVLIRQEF